MDAAAETCRMPAGPEESGRSDTQHKPARADVARNGRPARQNGDESARNGPQSYRTGWLAAQFLQPAWRAGRRYTRNAAFAGRTGPMATQNRRPAARTRGHTGRNGRLSSGAGRYTAQNLRWFLSAGYGTPRRGNPSFLFPLLPGKRRNYGAAQCFELLKSTLRRSRLPKKRFLMLISGIRDSNDPWFPLGI